LTQKTHGNALKKSFSTRAENQPLLFLSRRSGFFEVIAGRGAAGVVEPPPRIEDIIEERSMGWLAMPNVDCISWNNRKGLKNILKRRIKS
jgi:hypothetical protein